MARKPVNRETMTRFCQRQFFERPNQPPLMQESGTKNSLGTVQRYAFAYIDFELCAIDNGRMLDYDIAHGYAERHFMGKATLIAGAAYEDIRKRFYREVLAIREEHYGDV